MKLLAMLVVCLFTVSSSHAGSRLIDLFQKNEGKIIDWAIAESVEAAFYYGNAGRKGIGGQIPLLYIADGVLSGDLGFVTITTAEDDKISSNNLESAELAVGVSLRINRLLELSFPDAFKQLRDINDLSRDLWDRGWFGPAYTYNSDRKEHIGWFKMGIKLWGK